MFKNTKYILYCLIILSLKLFLIFKVPLLDDEAYFIEWSKNLDFGYYEHTPLVAWILWCLSFVSSNYIFFRLFSFISLLICTFVIYKTFSVYDQNKSVLISVIFLLSIVNLFAVPLTNDVPLLVFGALSFYFLVRFYQSLYYQDAILSFLFLGFCFLSKYIAIPWGISFIVSIAIFRLKKLGAYLLIGLIVMSPFIFLNLYWNYTNCWTNVLFNLFNRIKTWNFYIPLQYFLVFILVLNPFFMWGIVKHFKYLIYNVPKDFYFFFSIVFINFLIYLVISFKNTIGANWIILLLYSFYFIIFYYPSEWLEKLIKFSFIYTFIIGLLLIVSVLFIPHVVYNTDLLKRLNINHGTYVYSFKPKFICEAIESLAKEENINLNEDVIVAVGYSPAAILSYHCLRPVVAMFFTGPYGRFYDKKYDLRTFDNKNMIIFIENDNLQEFYSFFKKTNYRTFYVFGKYAFHLIIGKGFIYNNYKKEYLDRVIKKHYNIPKWLPIAKCYMYERYLN